MATATTASPPSPPPPPPPPQVAPPPEETTTSTATTTTTTLHQLEMAPQIPKGNWVARNLRLLNSDSHDLFPKTPAEHKPGKFHSMYKKDFYEYPAEVVMEGLAPKGKEPDRETIRDVLFGQSPTKSYLPSRPKPKNPMPPVKACLLPPNPEEQVFGAWKIPNRLSLEGEDTRGGEPVASAVPEKLEEPRIIRQSTLPALPAREGSKLLTPRSRVWAAEAGREVKVTTAPFTRAKTTLDPPSSSSKGPLVARLDLGNKLNTGVSKFKSLAAQWEERLPDVDPRLLHKVLRLQDAQQAASMQQQQQQQRLRGTLLPDARRTVERWLEGASEGERQVALQFFRSLAGSKLMGVSQTTTQHNTARLKEVIDALQRPGGRWVQEAGLSPRGGIFCTKLKPPGETTQPEKQAEEGGPGSIETTTTPKHLKYFHLLDSKTRQNRWMHTTWHHLPQYQHSVDGVNNSSSHYTFPQQLPHRHFVIHPDWPPQKK